MTTPKDNALHLMEGQGGAASGEVKDERAAFETWIKTGVGHPYAGQFANLMWAAWQARAAQDKTAHAHWVDEVEASGEAEKHAVCATCNGSTYVITGRGEFAGGEECPACVGGTPHFAIPPSTDVATLQRELSIAYDQIVRERGITKDLAVALQGLADEYDAASRSDNGPGWDAEAQAQMIAARAALSKVQHVAARGAEVSE